MSTIKGQIWSFDFMLGIFIFVGVLIVFSNSVSNIKPDITENLAMQGQYISDHLVNSGIPNNWTIDDVDFIGLTTEKRLDSNKVTNFNNIVTTNYFNVKKILGVRSDFYVYFSDANHTVIDINGISSIGKDYTIENIDNLVKIERFLIYQGSPIRMVVLVW